MKRFSKEKRKENRIRHEAFRNYYWQKQMDHIFIISAVFFVFCAVCFVVVVPFEHAKYPELGRIKYGTAVVGHLLAALFTKWLLGTKRVSKEKKPVVSEIFSFVVGLLYLLWGVLGVDIAIREYNNPVILMYLILLATITAFLYYRVRHYVWLIILSYSAATVCFLSHANEVKLDPTSSICAVTMMIILGVLSNTRYTYGRSKFEYEVENDRLIEEKAAQNEELEAQNEELISMNQELTDTTEKLVKALDDLEKATEAHKLFTNSMNHELRAPLNGIIGTIQVMQMQEGTSEAGKEYLEQCMLMSKSLLNIVNDLLDYAKMDAGEFEIFPAPFDLHDVIKAIEGTFKNQAKNKGLQLNFVIPDNMPCGLYGDDVRIQQILNNIVSNGVKYTDRGAVTVEASFENNVLKFVVSDTGQGMSQESLKDLFVPFKRIAESKNKKIQGTGLGMTIVMNLVNKMEGSIDVDSTPGVGTTFTIKLPSKITDANNVWGNHSDSEKSKSVADMACLQGKRLLYVDDTKMNLVIVEKLLAGTGMNVTTTTSAIDGLHRMMEEQYDVVLVDHMMPEMSGPELLQEMRAKSERNAQTPVIVFTGNAHEGIDREYTEMGFAGYICKPVMKDALLDILRKVLT